MNQPAEPQVYQCPGEAYTISRAVHLGRLAHHYPKCKSCIFNKEADLQPAAAPPPRPVAPPAGLPTAGLSRIFKAYDIRGIYLNELDRHLARRIGRATAAYLAGLPDHRQRETPLVLVVGRDMRTSSPELAAAAIEGIRQAGHNVIDIGLVTTPACRFAVSHLGAQGGLMTTASHNPPHYNGFKVFGPQAIPLGYESGLADIEKLCQAADDPPAPKRGDLTPVDITPAYLTHVLSFAGPLRPLKVAVDAGNGMAGRFVPLVLDKTPCHLVPLYLELDGAFPHHEPNPLHRANLRDLIAKVKTTGADVGFAFDGDGDRLAVVDERGDVVGSDLLTALIAQDLLARAPGSAVVYDLRSSWVVPEVVRRAGGVPVRQRVGPCLIQAAMRRRQAIFGGELSGHYYFRDNGYGDSALIAMIHLLNILSKAAQPLSQLIRPLQCYHQTGELNFRNEDADGTLQLLARAFANGHIEWLDGLTVTYRDWWFNVRRSNTEPLLRLTLEGRTRKAMNKGKQMVVKFLGEPVADGI